MPTVSARGYVRSIALGTRFSCYAPHHVCLPSRRDFDACDESTAIDKAASEFRVSANRLMAIRR
jgi:hypothetical protein